MLVHLLKLLVLCDGWDIVKPSSLGKPSGLSQVHSPEVGGETCLRRKSLTYSVPCEENPCPSLSLGGNVPTALALSADFSPLFYCCFDENTDVKQLRQSLHLTLLVSIN